jgi:hypothetical protein
LKGTRIGKWAKRVLAIQAAFYPEDAASSNEKAKRWLAFLSFPMQKSANEMKNALTIDAACQQGETQVSRLTDRQAAIVMNRS